MTPIQMLKIIRKAARLAGSQMLIERKKLYLEMAAALETLIRERDEMKAKCLNCGASGSIELFIAHEDARALVAAVAAMSDELTAAALRYVGLFRPAKKDLAWDRAAKLLGELVPMIQAGEITRNRQTYPAPREAWIWAFQRALEARSAGKLQTPLTTHGWLLENITFWTPEKTANTLPTVAADGPTVSGSPQQQQAAPSTTLQGAAVGEKYRR